MIDWTKPIETFEGKACRLSTEEECQGFFGGTNPDEDGDYWVCFAEGGFDWCVGADGFVVDETTSPLFGSNVRNTK